MGKSKKIPPTKKNLVLFNLIWFLIFLVISLYPFFKQGEIRLWSLIVSVAFLATAIIYPKAISGFYKVWTKFGAIIGEVNSKIILTLFFYLVITPFGVVMRLFGKDTLNKKLDGVRLTYWEKRDVQPISMKNQF